VGWVQEVELVAAPGTAVGDQAMVEVLFSALGEAVFRAREIGTKNGKVHLSMKGCDSMILNSPLA